MKNKMKGQQNIRRPLPIRLMALVMAVVMVFSVVYINNRYGEVKANDPEDPIAPTLITDDSFLSGFLPINNTESDVLVDYVGKTYNVHIPDDGTTEVDLTGFPAYTMFYTPDELYVKETATSGTYEIVDSTTEGAVHLYGHYSALSWDKSTIKAGDSSYLKKTGYKYYTRVTNEDSSITETEFTGTISEAPSNADITVLTVKAVAESLTDLSFDSTNGSVIDSNSNRTTKTEDDTTDVYYGDITYNYNSTTGNSKTTLDTYVSGQYNALEENGSTTVTVTKVLTRTVGTETSTIASKESNISLNKNDVLILKYSYKIGDADAVETAYSASPTDVTVPNIPYNKDFVFSITTDKEATFTGATMTKVGEGYVYSFTRDGGDGNKSELSKTYNISATDGDLTQVINLSINYVVDTPTVDGLKVNDTAVTTDPVYVKEAPTLAATITKNGSVPDGTLGISKVELLKCKDSSGTISDDPVIVKTIDNPESGDISSSVSTDYMQPGKNYYKYRLTGSYTGEVTYSGVYSVFYDDTDPVLLYIKVANNNTGHSADDTNKIVKNTISGTSIDFTEGKVSSQNRVLISIEPADYQSDDSNGSGLESIGDLTFNNKTYEASAAGVVYNYYIPASDIKESFKEGGSCTGTFTLKDKSGRTTEYSVKIYFFNEVPTVEYAIVSTGTDTAKGNYLTLLGQYGIVWDAAELSAAKGSFDVVYTITSEPDLKSVTLDGTTKSSLSRGDDGKYKVTFTKSYNFDSDTDKKYEPLKLSIVNNNDYPATHDIAVVEVDVTSPEMAINRDDDTTANPDGQYKTVETVLDENSVDDWYQNLVLLIHPTDATSGIATVTGEGIDNSPITILENGYGGAIVTESDSTSGTLVTLTVTDKAGLYSTASTTYKVDKQDPTAIIKVNGSAVSGDLYVNEVTSMEFEATDNGYSGINETLSTVYVKKGDAEESISWTSSGTITFDDIVTAAGDSAPIPNKGYAVKFKAYDNSGRIKEASVTIYIDADAPEAEIKVSGTSPKTADFYRGNPVSVKFRIKESNVKTITVKDNNETVAVPAFSSWTDDGDGWKSTTISVSAEKMHTFTLEVVDQSSKTVSASPVTFTYDNTPPSVTTLLNGSEYTKDNSYNKSVTAGISYSDDNKDDNDITATIVRDIPGGGQTTSTKKGLGPHSISEDGKYTVTYKVVDKAGNSTTTDPIGFTVDNTAPVHNLYVTTANPSKVEDYPNNYINGVGKWQSSHEAYRYGQFYNGDVTVELNYFDYNLDWVYVTDNGEEISPSWTKNGAFGKATYTFTSEGYHDVQIWSKDLSGNETNDTVLGKRVRFTIDRSAPSITTYLNSSLYSEGSGTRYLNTNGSLNVSVSEGNKDTYDLTRSYKVTPPGGTSKTYEDKVDEGTENYSEEADYEVSYVAVDKAGNKSATRNVYFRVDRTAPKLTINGPGSSSNASSTSVSFNVQESFYWDMTSCTVKIYKKVDGSGEVLEKTLDMNPSSANYSQSYSFVDDAEYRMEFTAEDKCGNKSQTDYTFIKDGNAPSILLSGVKNYDKTDKNVELTITIEEAFYTSNRVTLSGTRTDIDGKSHKIDFDDFATNRTKISQLQQMFKEDGIYDITVTSTDKAGNSSSKTVHFTIDTTKPVIGDLSKYDGVKLNTFKWDVDLDELVKDLTVCDIKLYLDGALYDGTSDIEDGSHVLKVEATDELGHSSSKEVTFVLDSKAPNIIVMNVEEGDNLLESTDITVTVELDEDSLDTVTLNDKAINIANNEGKITVNEKGDYVLNATAHDEAGNVSSVEIKFSYGKQTNLLFIGIIAGAAILLLLLLLVFLRRRRNDN